MDVPYEQRKPSYASKIDLVSIFFTGGLASRLVILVDDGRAMNELGWAQ
jgi:hypothetical protein